MIWTCLIYSLLLFYGNLSVVIGEPHKHIYITYASCIEEKGACWGCFCWEGRNVLFTLAPQKKKKSFSDFIMCTSLISLKYKVLYIMYKLEELFPYGYKISFCQGEKNFIESHLWPERELLCKYLFINLVNRFVINIY